MNSNHTRNREHELVEFLRANPKKWKGLQRLLEEQIDDIKEVVHVMPLLYVEVRCFGLFCRSLASKCKTRKTFLWEMW